MSDTLDRLQPVFRDVLDDTSLRVERATTASDVRGWDSLAHVQLVSTIEQEFGVYFALAEIQSLKNVGDMVDLIERKLQAG